MGTEDKEMENEKVELNWDEEKKGGISDTIRKVVATGLSSPFLSEDQLKIYLSGLNRNLMLSKSFLNFFDHINFLNHF